MYSGQVNIVQNVIQGQLTFQQTVITGNLTTNQSSFSGTLSQEIIAVNQPIQSLEDLP